MANILLLGYDGLLASELAARILASSQHCLVLYTEDDVSRRDEIVSVIREAFRKQLPGADAERATQDVATRFSVESFQQSELAGSAGESQFEEVWLVEGSESADHLSPLKPIDRVSDALSLLSRSNARVFNYVCPMYGTCEGSTRPDDVEREIRTKCDTRGIGHRVFRVAALLGENYLRAGSGGNDIRQLMAALDDVTAEAQERLPEYFDYQSLHLLARPDARMNVVRTESAAEIVVQIAQQESTLGKCHTIASPQDIPMKNIARILGKAYGAGISLVADKEQLNSIDRLLAERFTAVGSVFSDFATVGHGNEQTDAGLGAESLLVDEPSLKKLVAVVREKQVTERAIREKCAASFFSRLEPKSIQRPGGRLDYFVAGSQGPHVLVLNALGQGLKFWTRMVDRLAQCYRVVIWETRGLEYDSEPLKFSDHLDDIDSILQQEEIKQCYVLGWCTGPQLATEFYLRRPEAVMGMVFLNSVFKFEKRLDVETPYSINLEKLCRLLDHRPEMAASVMQSLSTPPASEINLESTDSHNTAQQILSLTNVHLRTNVLDPFRTVRTTLNYARQIVNLLACPVVEKLNQLDVPILIVGCEYDQVASPAKSREAARLLPSCKYVELQGATHYSIYDRTEVVAMMLRRFFDAPRTLVQAEEPLAAVAS